MLEWPPQRRRLSNALTLMSRLNRRSSRSQQLIRPRVSRLATGACSAELCGRRDFSNRTAESVRSSQPCDDALGVGAVLAAESRAQRRSCGTIHRAPDPWHWADRSARCAPNPDRRGLVAIVIDPADSIHRRFGPDGPTDTYGTVASGTHESSSSVLEYGSASPCRRTALPFVLRRLRA